MMIDISKEEREELESYIKILPEKRGALLPTLNLFQRKRGYIDDMAIKEIGKLLELSPTEVMEVATFYHFIYRRPMGRVIKVCQNVSCHMAGGERIFRYLEDRLGIRDGETTEDGRFSLIGTACLGRCERGPVIMVNDMVHDNVTLEKVEEICSSQSS